MDILGIQKTSNTLKLSPHIPVSWDNFKMVYNYMDTEYNIEVIKTTKDELVVDGRTMSSNIITLKNDKSSHEVTLYIKK